MKKRNTLDLARERLRLLEIYNTFSIYLLEIALDRGLLGDFRRWMQQWIFNPPQPLALLSLPVKVRLLIQDLGPTFIKMGQIVSSRSESLPPEWQRELNRLQSNVPPFPSEEVREIIIEEFGAPPEQIYATFDPEPFAAASTAQVHRASLTDGSQVVVKVQRPNIREQMRADLGIMRNAARVAERRMDWARNIDLSGMLDEFGSNALTELDYRGEAYNAFRLSDNMAKVPGVHVATVYPFLSTSKVLTQEFIKGVKITDLEAIDAAGLDRRALAEASLRAMIKQLLIDGFFHGDPHPGNVLVNLETGMITFIDLGMVGELSVQSRLSLIRLLMVTNQRDARAMAQVVRNLSVPYRGEVDTAAFDRAFERQISRVWLPGMPDDFSTVMDASFDLLQEYGLRLDAQLTLALKALMQAEAISNRLAMKGLVVSMAVQIIQAQAAELITADNIIRVAKKEGTHILGEVFNRLPTLQEATIKWLDQYEKGQFTVKIDATELSEALEKTQGFGAQVIVGIILAGMIIGSAIAASVPHLTGRLWEFMPKLALIGYTFAMVLAAFMVIGLMWRIMRDDSKRKR